VKKIVAILFKYYFYRTIKGRYISVEDPLKGRFSKRQVHEVYKNIITIRDEIMECSDLSIYKSHGNRLLVYCGIISLAAYRALKKKEISHSYATLLVTDTIWSLYIVSAKSLWKVSALFSQRPQKRLNLVLGWLCIYPFNTDKKGYQYQIIFKKDCLEMNFTQCAAHQFMLSVASKEEMDFFKESWCLFDYALPGYLIKGGHYERRHTLSSGDAVCDMKWYAPPTKPNNKH